MPFCGECGTKYEDGCAFCPNCGARIEVQAEQQTNQASIQQPYEPAAAAETLHGQAYSAPQQEKKGGWKRLLPILIGGAALIALVVILIVTGAFQSKTAKFRAMQRAFLFDPLAQIAGGMVATSEQPDFRFADTLTLTGSVTGTGSDEEIKMLLDDSSVEIKADIDAAKESSQLEVNLVLQDNPLLSAFLMQDGDEFTFHVPAMDDEIYTLNLPEFLKNLDELIPEDVTESLDDPAALFGGLTEKEVEALVNKYSGILLGIVNKKNITVKSEKIELLDSGETLKCKVYTVTPTEKDYLSVFKALCDEMADDEDLRTIALAAYSMEYIPYGTDKKTVEDRFDDEWEDFLDNFEDNMDDTAERLADQEMTWQTALKGKRIVMQNIFSADSEQGLRYETTGATLKARTDAILMIENGDEIVAALRNDYTVDRKQVDGKLSLEAESSYYSMKEFSFGYTFDLAKPSSLAVPYGDYTFKYPDMALKAMLTVEDGDRGDLHAFDVSVEGYRIKVDVVSEGEAPKIDVPKGSATDITDYTEDELSTLVYGWGETLSAALYGVLESIM